MTNELPKLPPVTPGPLYQAVMIDGDCADEFLEYVQAYARAAVEQAKCLSDDPELDATDFAHPAWWRGHSYTVKSFCRKVHEILDGKDSGTGVANYPWESLRQRLLKLSQPTASAGVTDGFWERLTPRQRAVTEFALRRFVWAAHESHNAASQKDTAHYFKEGAADSFYNDAKDAEKVLAALSAAKGE